VNKDALRDLLSKIANPARGLEREVGPSADAVLAEHTALGAELDAAKNRADDAVYARIDAADRLGQQIGATVIRADKAEADLAAAVADRNEIIGNGAGMNDGPYTHCTDCGRHMVWQRPTADTGDTFHHPGSWMCPNCVLDNLHRREADLAAMTAERNGLRRALDANAEQLAQEIATARTLCEQRDAAQQREREQIERTGAFEDKWRAAVTLSDSALSRVSELEAQRDEARRECCEWESTSDKTWVQNGPLSVGRPLFKRSPRDVAVSRWPADADRLFGRKGGE
jgi:hypothetical protein